MAYPTLTDFSNAKVDLDFINNIALGGETAGNNGRFLNRNGVSTKTVARAISDIESSNSVIAAGIVLIDECEVATSADIVLSGLQTIDGITLEVNDRVLVRAQTDAGDNGIYLAKVGGWTRALDFDQTAEVVEGAFIPVGGGSLAGGWVLVTPGPVTVGTTDLTFRIFNYNDADKINFQRAGSAYSNNIADVLKNYINVTSFIPRELRDNILDGTNTTSLHPYIQDALDQLAIVGGGVLWFPKGTYYSTTVCTADTRIQLKGEPGAILDVGNANSFVNFTAVDSIDNGVDGFEWICSALVAGAVTSSGIVYRDGTVGTTRNFFVTNNTVNTPKNGRDFVLIVAKVLNTVSGVNISNNYFIETGRMNVEIIQHDSDLGTTYLDGIKVTGNRFGKCGTVGIKIACSLSGAMKSPLIEGNEYVGYDATAYGLELVGNMIGPRVISNHFRGTFGMIISQSDRGVGDRVYGAVVMGNTTEEGTVGKVFFGSSVRGVFTGNSFDITATWEFVHTYTTGNFFWANKLISANSSALMFDNSPSNRAIGNYISNVSSAGNFAPVWCYNSSCTLNRVQHNELIKGTGGGYFLENVGAAGNIQGGNIHGTFQTVPPGFISATQTFDPPSLAAGVADVPLAITVAGIAVGDMVMALSFSIAGLAFKDFYVSAANTVMATPYNPTTGTLNLGSGTIRVVAFDMT